jgi:hypothetical protein
MRRLEVAGQDFNPPKEEAYIHFRFVYATIGLAVEGGHANQTLGMHVVREVVTFVVIVSPLKYWSLLRLDRHRKYITSSLRPSQISILR